MKIHIAKLIFLILTILLLSGCGKNLYLEFTEGSPKDDMKCSVPIPAANAVTKFEDNNSRYQLDNGRMLMCRRNFEKNYIKSYLLASMEGRTPTHVYINQSGAFASHIRFVPIAEADEANQRDIMFYIKEYGIMLTLLSFVGLIVYIRKSKKLAEQETHNKHEEFCNNEPAIVWDHTSFPATDVIQSLAAGAVLSTANGFALNIISPQRSAEEMRDWLDSSWHIFNAQDFDTQFQSLLNFGHAYIYNRIIELSFEYPEMLEGFSQEVFELMSKEYAEDMSSADLKESLENFPKGVKRLKELGYINSDADLRLGTKAYDIDRAVTITRVSAGAGYIPNKVGLNYVMNAGDCARYFFSSWREFGTSLLLGRAIWGDVDDPNVAFDYRLKTVELLLNSPESPWVKAGWFPPHPAHEEKNDEDLDNNSNEIVDESTDNDADEKPVIH